MTEELTGNTEPEIMLAGGVYTKSRLLEALVRMDDSSQPMNFIRVRRELLEDVDQALFVYAPNNTRALRIRLNQALIGLIA